MKIYPYLVNYALESKSKSMLDISQKTNKLLSLKGIVDKSNKYFSLMASLYDKDICNNHDIIESFYDLADRTNGEADINMVFEEDCGDVRKRRGIVCNVLAYYDRKGYTQDNFKVFRLKNKNKSKIYSFYFPFIYLSDTNAYRLELRDENNKLHGLKACFSDSKGAFNLGTFIVWQIEENSERVF